MITREDLHNYAFLSSEIDDLEKEITMLWNTYRSPAFDRIGSRPLSPSDPTANAVRQMEQLEEKLREKQDRMRSEVTRIEEWMDDLDDHEIASIIRCKYVMRMTWRQVAIHIYGNSSADAPRKALKRFFREKK